MSFFRRNNDNKDEGAQAVPSPDAMQTTPPERPQRSASEAGEPGNPIARLRQWLVDSYRGLYKVVIGPSMPSWLTIILLIIGVIIGMTWAYLIAPPVFVGANPERLNRAAQDQWIKMVAVGYDTESRYGEAEAIELLSRVEDPVGNIQRLLQETPAGTADYNALQTLLNAVGGDVQGTPMPQSPGLVSELINMLTPLLLVLIVTPILVVVWRLLFYPNVVAPIVKQARVATDSTYREQVRRERAELSALQQQKRELAEMKKQSFGDVDWGEPVMQTIKIYTQGRTFDESNEIELPPDEGGAFLGQCGAVIAEVVAPDPVALEVWLFDMFSQQTLKKIFVTEAGWNEGDTRARLEADVDDPAQDIVIARPGARLGIESDKLFLQAELATLEIDDTGRFANFRLRMAAWQNERAAVASTGGSPGGLPPSPPAPENPSLGSLMNTGYNREATQPHSQGTDRPEPEDMERLSPPPLNYRSTEGQYASSSPGWEDEEPYSRRPSYDYPPGLGPEDEDEEDDPFGSTGDFTPLPRD